MDFVIDQELELGRGSEAVKFRDNVAAIRTLKAIEAEGRRASPEEQRILARYVGWGGLKNAFRVAGAKDGAGVAKGWESRVAEIEELLTAAELRAARNSTTAAHYTSEAVVNGVWKAVQRLGFRGGAVLEPSMGTGNFVGLMPAAVRGSTQVVGVEYDSLTARIAQQLYPNATVLHSGFQELPMPTNQFALAIGNPPFGKESLYFRSNPAVTGMSIHNQFFVASLDSVAPDGIMGMVVSRYLMDAQNNAARLAMAERAEFLGAIRLPDTAFQENARTEVVTDMVFFRKRRPGEVEIAKEAIENIKKGRTPIGAADQAVLQEMQRIAEWTQAEKVENFADSGEDIGVNRYFLRNPGMVVGRMDASSTMQARVGLNVKLDDPSTLPQRLDAAIALLPEVVPKNDVQERTAKNFALMATSLRLAVRRAEPGGISVTPEGQLKLVVDVDGGDMGKSVLTEITLDEKIPYAPDYQLNTDGKWQRVTDKLGADGKPVKQVNPKTGKPSMRNEKELTIFESAADIPANHQWGAERIAMVRAMLPIRDLMKRQLMLESSDSPEGMLRVNRKRLNDAYDAFVKAHGPLHGTKSQHLAMTMPDGALALATERVVYQGKKVVGHAKADILERRVVEPTKPVEAASSIADAVAISLGESGGIDVDRIAQLMKTDVAGAERLLSEGENPRAFFDPELQRWESADAYLSGLVRRKLLAAKSAGLDGNIKALEAVQPEDWDSSQITPTMGGAWIPPRIYADFLKHLGYEKAHVSYSALTNSFTVSAEGKAAPQWTLASSTMTAQEMAERTMNSKAIVVQYTDSEGKVHVDEEATAEAQMKGREIFNEFQDWAYADDARRAELVRSFNEKFNTRVTRQRDGSHLKLPGKVPDAIIKMRRHQKNAIWRGITDSAVLYDHVVGAGKTYTAIARIMERRRMGLSRKPMVVVPNHLVEQWASDVLKLYPGANILAAGKADFEKANRRRLFARIAAGDYDMVIMGHSSFGFISIDPATEERYLDEELRAATAAIAEAQKAAEEEGYSGYRKPFGVAEAERLVKRITERLARLRDGKRDRLLTFEEMGVDDLTIDESHEFKNLAYTSRLTKVSGMGNKTGSAKATDLNLKLRSLNDRTGTSVAFLTGTPISNSAAEMYLILKNLAPKELKEMGMDNFDAWRTLYASVGTAYEPTESGSLKEVARLGREWTNMRSLMDLYYSVSDAVTMDDIKSAFAEENPGSKFPIPEVRSAVEGNGDREMVVVKPTAEQRELLRDIVAGFEGLPGIQDPKERNIERLRLMDRARKVSLDVRAVDPFAKVTDPSAGKIGAVVNNVARIYHQWSADKGTQIVFLDRSVPKAKGDDKRVKEYDDLVQRRLQAMNSGDDAEASRIEDALEKFNPSEMEELRNALAGGWNAYAEIKQQLVAQGIPANEIRFVQETNTDDQKRALFDLVKSGEVRVLIGSTPRMGAGTNVQDRLVGLHHVDVTWKPSDIEQREGRIVRQGNLFATPTIDGEPNPLYRPNFTVDVMAYATEMTVDAKMWSLNATKLKAINGVRKYDGSFNMEFEDEESASMAEMAALATGNPLMIERVVLDGEVKKLEMAQRSFGRRISAMRERLANASRVIANGPSDIETLNTFAQAVAQGRNAVLERSSQRTVTVQGKAYSTLVQAQDAAAAEIAKIRTPGNENARFSIEVNGTKFTQILAVQDAIEAALGSPDLEVAVGGETHIAAYDAGKAIAAKANGKGDTFTIDGIALNGIAVEVDVAPDRYGKPGTKVASFTALNDQGREMASYSTTFGDGKLQDMSPQLARSGIDKLKEKLQPEHFTDRAQRIEQQMEAAKRDIPELRVQAGQAFPQAQELEDKRARLGEVVSILASQAQQEQGDAAADASSIRRSFAGQQAATADQHALATAQQRLDAGEDAEAVRQDTGWFRGADGKWRFEINDADAKLQDRAQWTRQIDKLRARRDEALKSQWEAEEQRNAFLRLRGESPSRISADTKKTPEFKALAKAVKAAEAAAEKAQSAVFSAEMGDSLMTVGDVLSHPALFSAYPGVASLKVEINRDLPVGNASYTYETQTIELSEDSDQARLLSTLLHEIQHGIQKIEGFARGGSPRSVEAVTADLHEQRQTALMRGNYQRADELSAELARWADDAGPMEGYRRLAGEVEARNTQARQAMTDEQRRATPPSQTADVADSDVIVMFNGKVAANAPLPANAAPDAAQQAPRTPAATIRAAISKAYGKLLGQLEAKGLVTLAQTEAQAVEAAAQARAAKTGGDVAQIKRSLTAAMQGDTDLDVKRSAALSGITFSEDVVASYAGQTNHTLTAKSKNDVAGVLEYVVYEGVPSISMVSVSEKNRRQGIGRALVQELQSKFPDIEIEWGMLTEDGAALRNSLQFEERPNIDVQRKQNQLEIAVAERSQLEAEANKRRDSDDYSAWIQTVSERWNELHDEIDELESDLAAAGPAVRRIVVASETQQSPASIDIKRSANGAVQGFFDPQTGQSFLIADNLTAEAAPGVLMHEVGIHMAADGTMQPLFDRVGRLLKAQKGNPFMQRVQARMDAAKETSNEEAAAYLVEAFENDRANAPASVRKWLADLLAAVKAWMYRKGITGADSLTVADIAAVARANAKSFAAGGTTKDAQPDGVDYSVAKQLESDNFYEAYRRALESGRTLGEDEITEGLAGTSKGGQRRGVLGFAGAKNPSTSTVFWDGEILGERGYYTTAVMRGKAGKRELIMFAIPGRAAPDGLPEQLMDAVRSNKVVLHAAARELEDGSWEFAVDGAQPTSPYYDELIERGELEPVANGYHRLKIPGANNNDFLREMARRLSMALDGKTPNIRYERATGWNTKRGDMVIPASKVEAKFSRATPQPAPAAATWQAPSLEDAKHRTAWDNIVYALQDKMVDVKRVQQAIRDTGQQIADDQDVRLKEELYHARVSHKSQEFAQKELDPMVKLLAERGVELADFESYLHARHAPEANRVMMERNPTEQELQERMDAIYAQIEPLEAFKASAAPKEQARLQRLIDQGIRKIELLTTVQPWRGSEEDRQKLSGMSNEEAAAIMAALSPKERQTMEEAARQFDAIVQKNRQEMVDYDLESQDTVDGWADMFEFYVPLMREDEGNAQGTGQGISIKGREVKSRTGSTRKVVDIVANLAMQRERTIVRGEENRVSQALVGLASANPNPDFWRVGGPDVERKFDLRTGTVKTVTNPNYKNLPNVVTAKLRDDSGAVKEVAVVFNEDDNRAKRMAETLKNLDGQTLEGLYAATAPITRYMASMSTQYNPIFGITNLARDLQGAMVNLAGTPLADQKGKIAWLAKNAIADIYRAARADRKNEAHTGEWTQWWDMFQEDGGPTGYRDIFQDSADRTKAITKTMNPDAWMESAFGKVATANGLLKDPAAAAAKGAGWVFDWLSDYNLAMENGIRVSTYRAAVESGMSRERAASLAKNITVNFNRKGQMALKTGALYAFFNAAVQGTARIGEALVTMEPGKPKTMRLSRLGKKVVYGGIMLGALQALALAAMGFDDENPQDFVRERNTIIPVGGGKFITIPMPLGLHVFPGLGRHAVEFALSGGKDPSKRAIKIMGMLTDSFYPLGSAGMSMQTLTPTVLDPLAALLENRDYAGRPIARESMDKNVPGHELTRTTATWFSQGIAEGINWITGGDKYVAGVASPTPDQIDYLIGQATGGVGREVLKAVQTVQTLATGEELPMHKVPLLGRFFGTANGSASQSGPFYAKVNEAKRIDRRIDGLREDGQRQEAQTLERSNQLLLAKARIADRQVTRLRREKRQLLDKGAPREQVREVERKMADAMRRFNESTAKP